MTIFLCPLFWTICMTFPLFIDDTLEIWEFKSQNKFFQGASFLAQNFFLLSEVLTSSNFAILVIQPLAFLAFDALVVYRLWIYKGFSMDSRNKLSSTLSALLMIKYTYLNNSIVVQLAKVSFCRIPQKTNFVNTPLRAYNSDLECGNINYYVVLGLSWLAIGSQLVLNILFTSINYLANISKNRKYSK